MVGTRSSPGRGSTPRANTPTSSSTPTARQAAPKKNRQLRTRIRLAANNDDSEDDGVMVSSGVVVAAMRPTNLGGDSDSDEHNQQGQGGGVPPVRQHPQSGNNQQARRRSPPRQAAPAPAPPIATRGPAPAPVIVNAPTIPATRLKVKALPLEDFRGTSGESVEAWLATIPQEVERQAGLGGDTWTAEELYFGVTAHLKDRARTWLTKLTAHMRPEDKTLDFLVRKLRQKYGRRDSIFKIYVEAFINGINNQAAAMQVRGHAPRTLEDAVQFAEDTCGEYGEGYKVTDWRVAKRRYRDEQDADMRSEETPPPRKKSAVNPVDQLDWSKLGLGFGREESPPNQSAKRDPVSMAALQALIMTAGASRSESPETKPAASKIKARALEVKAETREGETHGEEPPQHHLKSKETSWQERSAGRGYGGGRGAGGRGYGSGRGGAGHYGPPADRPSIMEQKANSRCGYCSKPGHWWRECRARLAAFNGSQGQPQQSDPAPAQSEQQHASSRTVTNSPTTPVMAAENGQRQ
eukprot:jgi/Phyca11/120029/e_gw1.40.109.1